MLDRRLVCDVLDEALSTGGDFAEVFAEKSHGNILNAGEGKVKESSSYLTFGVGIRVFKGHFQTYAYTNVTDRENLLKTAKKAAFALKEKREATVLDFVNRDIENLHKIKILPDCVKKEDKVSLLLNACREADAYNPLIVKSDASYLDKERQILVANSNGVWAEDRQVRTRFFLNAIACRDNVNESDRENIGGLCGWELYENVDWKAFAARVAQNAIDKTYAVNCPSGKMTVILNNGFGGVIFHEACGHGLEATALAKSASVFCNKKGEKIASELVSAVDDATIPNAWGSYNIDDEGLKGERKVLIENGILKNYMIDSFNARLMGEKPNGCSRRESYKFIPTSRMSNTFIMNGKSSLEEIIADTEYGLFAANMQGGSVNTASGDFNFSVDRAYIVEKGKIKQQVKGAKLIGNGADVLQNIDMVGNNMTLTCGMCGSVSGSIPTTVGQPALRVQNITVGGQK